MQNLKKTNEPIKLHLDSPQSVPSNDIFLIQGWIISYFQIKKIWIRSSSNYYLSIMQRPDVKKAFPNYPFVYGFTGNADNSYIKNNSLEIFYSGKSQEYSSVFSLIYSEQIDFECKIKKLKAVIPLLLCPFCTENINNIETSNSKKFTCKNCKSEFDYNGNNINFLTESFKKKYQIIDSANVSIHEYDEIALNIINNCKNGLVLDCGAGKKSGFYQNVINYDIAEFPNIDVLGVNENLPFINESFDAVFSLNVLEHVTDPFKSSKELIRVLKKDGILYCVAPFLQPFHDYPNHYYNFSREGLLNLFKENIKITESRVPPGGLPVWALNWILKSWSDGLLGKTKNKFLNMKIKDLINNPLELLEKDFVRNLSPDKNAELACTNMIIGKKL
jgi:SAM-dependent methyltransferase